MSKKCTPLWREAHFQVKMYKTPGVRTTFGSCDVEKVHAVVARSTFRSQNVQSTPGSDHFWKLRCRKSARRCGVKHISKSKCTKHTRFGPLLEVQMSKKCRKSARRCGAKHIWKATTACTFSTSQLPKVVRSSSVLSILTWKCASCHNGVHFFMSHLASWLRTRRFSEPTFRPSGATNHWKNTVNRDFPIFSRICIFFLLILSLLTRLTSAFQLSILSEVSLLNFLR